MINLFSKWKDKVAQYIDVRLDLAKLAFIERTSHVLSYLIFTFMLLSLGAAILVFMGIGLQEAFSVWVDSRIGGAFLTAGFYLLLCVLVYALRKPILAAFAGLFIQILTRQDDDDDAEKPRPRKPQQDS